MVDKNWSNNIMANLVHKYDTLKVKYLIVFILLSLSHLGKAQEKAVAKNVDAYINQLMERQGIPGLALAIISKGQVIHQKSYGFANLEHQVPVSDYSIFRLYSLTKPMVSVAIFQLIEHNKLKLSDVISQHVNGLPQSWQSIQIKQLLSHSSGLPDMAALKNRSDLTEPEAKEAVFLSALKFEAGNRYDYNQTNFWLLQQVIETLSQSTVSGFIVNHQFNADSNSVFFSSDSRDIVRNRTTPYFYFTKGTLSIDHSFMQGDYGHAMNGLNVSLSEFIQWDKKLTSGQLLNKVTQKQMFSDFEYSESNKSFAYGWNKFNANGHDSYGFTGSYVTGYQTFPDKKLSIVLLSNGLSYWYNMDNIINYIAGLVNPEVVNLNNYMFETLLQASIQQPFSRFKKTYAHWVNDPSYREINFENQLNDVGYMLLNIKNDSKAIEVFQFNVTTHPKSWQAYDSLAEAYEKNYNLKTALINYQKALKLNRNNQLQRNPYLIKKIQQLNSLLSH